MEDAMTKNHENKLTMYEAVQSLLEANSDKTAGIPALRGIDRLFQGRRSKHQAEIDGAGSGGGWKGGGEEQGRGRAADCLDARRLSSVRPRRHTEG
jgi:hypothetical protein